MQSISAAQCKHASTDMMRGCIAQEVHALAHAQPANMETDPDTTRAVQRVFALVRNGDAAPDAKEPPLSLDDVVRFYNVRPSHLGVTTPLS